MSLSLFYKDRDKNFSFQVFSLFLPINYSVVGMNNDNSVNRVHFATLTHDKYLT